jgi:amino acid transporter
MSFPEQDRADLGRFGYAQELFRGMGGFSNFAISFSIISILTGAVTLFGYGLEMGGPLEMTLGWPLATVFTLVVAASMAELCSAYPTAGATYHWAADLGGKGLGLAGGLAEHPGADRRAGRHQLQLRAVHPAVSESAFHALQPVRHVRVHPG